MAHNLATIDGRVAYSFASADGPAWHGLGMEVEASTATGAFSQSIDYPVYKEPAYTFDGIDKYSPIPGKFAVIRGDTRAVLGVVGDNYKVFQNAESFAFLDPLVQAGSMAYSSVGALGAGERTFIACRRPEAIRMGSAGDLSSTWWLFTNTHDGSGAIRFLSVGWRVVCNNTYPFSAVAGTSGYSIRHTENSGKKLDALGAAIRESDRLVRETAEKACAMAEIAVSDDTARDYFAALLDTVIDRSAKESTTTVTDSKRERLAAILSREQSSDLLDEILSAASGGKKEPDAKTRGQKRWELALNTIVENYSQERELANQLGARDGSAWQAYNAVSGWVDHQQNYKGTLRARLENRLESLTTGRGAEIKQRAFASALAL